MIRYTPIGVIRTPFRNLEGIPIQAAGASAVRGHVDIDILHGTPLLDIKPYVPEFDCHPAECVGWLEQAKGMVRNHRADSRLVGSSDVV